MYCLAMRQPTIPSPVRDCKKYSTILHSYLEKQIILALLTVKDSPSDDDGL